MKKKKDITQNHKQKDNVTKRKMKKVNITKNKKQRDSITKRKMTGQKG